MVPVFSRRGTTGRSRASDAGLSLVEVCVTVAILSIVVVAITTSMITASATSDLSAKRSQVESYARRVAEIVRSDIDIQCGADLATRRQKYVDAIEAKLPADSKPTGLEYDVTAIVSTTSLTSSAPATVDPSTWSESCSTAQALARVTITTRSTNDPAITASVSVVQRNASIS